MKPSHTDLARALFDAFAAGDAEAARVVCAPDMQGNQNDGPFAPLDAVLHFAVAVKQIAPDFRYEDIICSATQTGFVEEHRVCATFPSGDTLNVMIAIIGTVEDGKITQLREYFDSAAGAPLAKALQGA